MSDRDQKRPNEILRGALGARMAGSIALTIGVAVGFVTYADGHNHVNLLAIYAVAGVSILAAVIFWVVRWFNRLVRGHDA